MENPYESPATRYTEVPGEAPTSSLSPEASGEAAYTLKLSWGLLLIASGCFGVCLLQWFDVAISFLDSKQMIEWMLWRWSYVSLGEKIAAGTIGLGCLLCVYIPPRFRVARYAMLAAAVQLISLAGLEDWLPSETPSTFRAAVIVYVPTLALIGLCLYFLAERKDCPTVVKRLRATGIATAVLLGLSFACEFVATAGDTVERMVGANWFVYAATRLLMSLVSLNFFWQLLAIRPHLCKLTHEENQLE